MRAPSTRRRLARVLEQREVSLLVVLVALFGLFSILSSRFATGPTISQILMDMSIVVIVGVGEALVLFTRNIDVSVGSMVGFTAYFVADFSANHRGVSILVVVLLSCFVGLILGAINGALVATLRVPSIMVTLGTLYIYRGLDSVIAGSGLVTSQELPLSYSSLASWSLHGLPGIFLYAAVIVILAHGFVRHTYTGRSVIALGSNPEAAVKIGIRSRRWVFGAFALSGVLCGFAGVLWGGRYGTVDSSAASGFELVVLAAVVVGGVSVSGGSGSIAGVLVGSTILSVISIGLALVNVSQFWLQAIQGLVIISALILDVILRGHMKARRVGS